MPHLTLELTSDLPPTSASRTLLLELHRILADTGGIPIGNCKSRVVVRDRFAVADGSAEEGFVHLEVVFLEGRAPEVKRRIGQELLEAVCRAFDAPDLATDRGLQVTVELREMTRESYFKYPAGTL